jgi:hypothetical protein
MSDDGNAVESGRSNMKTTQDALRENKSQSNTNSRRESNANYYNVNSGAKKNLDNDDKATTKTVKTVKK